MLWVLCVSNNFFNFYLTTYNINVLELNTDFCEFLGITDRILAKLRVTIVAIAIFQL